MQYTKGKWIIRIEGKNIFVSKCKQANYPIYAATINNDKSITYHASIGVPQKEIPKYLKKYIDSIVNGKVSWIWAEMARVKLQFHKNEEWDLIELWGLFNKSSIKTQIKNKELIFSNLVYSSSERTYEERRGPQWVKPSEEAYNKYIKPLLEEYTLEELTKLAGWE
jgi:hypothetical protein